MRHYLWRACHLQIIKQNNISYLKCSAWIEYRFYFFIFHYWQERVLDEQLGYWDITCIFSFDKDKGKCMDMILIVNWGAIYFTCIKFLCVHKKYIYFKAVYISVLLSCSVLGSLWYTWNFIFCFIKRKFISSVVENKNATQ